MNCENIPILDDPDDPIYLTILPPPLHTILLGPVNHVIKELRKRHPVIMKTIDNLHIQQSKYHGKNFEGNQFRAIGQLPRVSTEDRVVSVFEPFDCSLCA